MVHLYNAASLFPEYMPTFLDVLSTEEYLNKIKILRNFREQSQVFVKPTRVVLFELFSEVVLNAAAKSSGFIVRVIQKKQL